MQGHQGWTGPEGEARDSGAGAGPGQALRTKAHSVRGTRGRSGKMTGAEAQTHTQDTEGLRRHRNPLRRRRHCCAPGPGPGHHIHGHSRPGFRQQNHQAHCCLIHTEPPPLLQGPDPTIGRCWVPATPLPNTQEVQNGNEGNNKARELLRNPTFPTNSPPKKKLCLGGYPGPNSGSSDDPDAVMVLSPTSRVSPKMSTVG